jgi:hypothetical protein
VSTRSSTKQEKTLKNVFTQLSAVVALLFGLVVTPELSGTSAHASGVYIPPPPPYGRKKPAEEAPCAPGDMSERCVKQRAASGASGGTGK